MYVVYIKEKISGKIHFIDQTLTQIDFKLKISIIFIENLMIN